MSIKEEIVTKGSGNVFADLGYANPQTHEFKASLVSRMNEIDKSRRLRNKDIAEIWQVDPADVSHVLSGQFRRYSIERLLNFLMAMNEDVDVFSRPLPKSSHRSGRLTFRSEPKSGKIAATD